MTDARPWLARRHHPPGVTPLEVWNLPVLGQEFWELAGAVRVDATRRAGVPEPLLTTRLVATVQAALELLVRQHAPDAVYLSGGLACLEGFNAELARVTTALPCAVHVAEAPRFAPVHAGLAVLQSLSARAPLSVDVGQTSIKCASPHVSWLVERSPVTLPWLFIGMPRPKDGHHLAAAVRFIAGTMHTFIETNAEAPDALCLALPCPLDEALRPGGCTYGWEGHASLITDIVTQAGLPMSGGTVWVLNDAELAAESARRDARVKGRKVLCLTLGFGPGGALLERT
ncbi:ROK family protein [Citreicoccus inhibens]|uniref:ROK family protein n=1 Tax=Citreicoccus inhibens TaxID=2849499 RepID=UPI002E29CC0A|nr:ROK family protein [Citreicoccus inhibens]